MNDETNKPNPDAFSGICLNNGTQLSNKQVDAVFSLQHAWEQFMMRKLRSLEALSDTPRNDSADKKDDDDDDKKITAKELHDMLSDHLLGIYPNKQGGWRLADDTGYTIDTFKSLRELGIWVRDVYLTNNCDDEK